MTATLAAPGRTRARPESLFWSEWGFVLAMLIAATVTVDPLDWNLAGRTMLKHLPLALALGFALLSAVGRKLRAPPYTRTTNAGILRTAWPLLAVSALIISGSLYERWAVGVRDTFLNVGLYMLMVFVAAAAVRDSEAPAALLRACLRVLLAAGAVMGVLLVANYNVRQVYHEQIYLVIPLAVYFFAVPRRTAFHWMAGLFFLAMTWFSHKFTSYAVGAATCAYILLFVAIPRLAARSALHRLTLVYWILLLALACAGAAVLVMLMHRSDLPSGNLEYRLHTYAEAWRSFTGSPLWGTLFVAEAVRKFKLYTIDIANNMLPTHSDLLDLLANGGLLTLGLWLYGLVRIARAAAHGALGPRRLSAPEAPYAHTLAMITIAGLITCAVNPILLQPPKAFLLWTSLGLLLGAARASRSVVVASRRAVASGGGNRKAFVKTYG